MSLRVFFLLICAVGLLTLGWLLWPQSSDSARDAATHPRETAVSGRTPSDGVLASAQEVETKSRARNVNQKEGPAKSALPAAASIFGLASTPKGLQATRVRPRKKVDSKRDYVLIDDIKAHPSRLLAKFSRSAQIAPVERVLTTTRYEPFRTPLNKSGIVVLEAAGQVDSMPAVGRDEAAARGQALQKQMAVLRSSGQFEYVEPDYVVSKDSLPSDDAFTNQTLWGLRNEGQNGGVSGADVDAVRAWDITTGSSQVIVGVLDTGIRYTHQDLTANMWRNPGETGVNAQGRDRATNGDDDDGNGYVDDVFGINAITGAGDPQDDNNHGTHCSGTIGAQANGGGSHVGVAWQVRLMGLKFLDASGSGYNSDAFECVEYGIDQGARILSNSWGGTGYSESLVSVIRKAAETEILFVAAAGNSRSDNDKSGSYPASYKVDNILSVAAINRSDALASFSNFGATTVHLGAPGVGIYSCTASTDASYASFNGTSMATPHVSGVAALVAARFPGLAMRSLKNRLLLSAVPTPALAGKVVTGGRVNAYHALTMVPDGALEVEVIPESLPLVGGTTMRFEVIVSDVDRVTGADVRASNTVLGIQTLFSDQGGDVDRVAEDGIYTAAINLPTAAELGGNGGTSTLPLQFAVVKPGKTSYLQTKTFAYLEPAQNDAFASATIISGEQFSSPAIGNVAATREPGEPVHAKNGGAKSVWWRWTAARSGWVQVDTQDSNFDTVLAVYQGNTLSTLVEVASNDDTEHAAFKWKSRLNFNATAGTTYSIAVDGFFYPLDNLTTSGIVRLRLQQNRPPTVVASVFYAQEAVPTSLALSANDPDGQELRFVITQTPLHGRAGTPNGIDGAFTYTSEPGFRGQDSFQVIATDGVENSLPTLVTINVVATVDTDNDGLPDAWETASSLRLGVNDAHEDPDSDGLTNLQEYLGGVDPKNAASGPMKINIGLIRPAFTPNANWGTSSGGNSLRNSLSSQVGPTTVPTQLWSGGSFANSGSSTFVEGGIVITTRFNPSDPNNRTSRQNGGWIQALSLETGALLWQKQLPIDLPATDDTSYAVGVNKGRVYATRGADGSRISFLYALDLATGNILWRSEEACFAEGFYDQSPVYTSEGDLIFSFQLKSYRINHLDGRTVWKSQNFNESYSCEAIYGNRLYGRYNKRNRAVLAAFDIETGAFLYQGDFFPAGFGVASGNPSIFISPEGTICLPVSVNNPKLDYLYAFEDTGTGFRFKWQSPLPYVFLNTFGAGPDDSIYSFSRDKRILRLRSRDGQIMHSSPVFPNMNLVSRMVVDASGAVFLSDGAGQLYSLNPDLTLRWQIEIANLNIGGPLLAENGTLVVASYGEGGVQAYRQLPSGFRIPTPTATPFVINPKVAIKFTGKILEQADSPAGPWYKITGASSPWIMPAEQTRKFFRSQLY